MNDESTINETLATEAGNKTFARDVVVIGAGITGLTTAYNLQKGNKSVLVLEKESRVGGQIRTYSEKGFTYESGPNTGVISNPEVAELFDSLAPECKILTAKKNAKKRLIWKGASFRPLPSGILSGITSPLFTFSDKMRILAEPFRKKGDNPNESVADMVRRRMGESYLDYACDPFLSGIYAGNPETLVTKYALPKLYNLEQNYGSFIKGSFALSGKHKSERDKRATKEIFSAEGGLESLPKALAKAIGADNISLGTKDINIEPYNGGWKIRYNTPDSVVEITAANIVTTVGAYALKDLLPFADSEQLKCITSLEYAPVLQAAVGLCFIDQNDYMAFGGLVPSIEKRNVLGILYPSACFDGRTPEDSVLFSFFLGGKKNHTLLEMSDENIRALIEKNLDTMLYIPDTASVKFIKLFRHKYAIPQYEASSKERLEAIENIQNSFSGLYLAGNIRDGIGMADRIKQGTAIAAEIINR